MIFTMELNGNLFIWIHQYFTFETFNILHWIDGIVRYVEEFEVFELMQAWNQGVKVGLLQVGVHHLKNSELRKNPKKPKQGIQFILESTTREV